MSSSTIFRATGHSHPLDVTFIDEEDLNAPWKRSVLKKLTGPMPKSLTVTIANLVYFEKVQLPQALANPSDGTSRPTRGGKPFPQPYRCKLCRMEVV